MAVAELLGRLDLPKRATDEIPSIRSLVEKECAKEAAGWRLAPPKEADLVALKWRALSYALETAVLNAFVTPRPLSLAESPLVVHSTALLKELKSTEVKSPSQEFKGRAKEEVRTLLFRRCPGYAAAPKDKRRAHLQQLVVEDKKETGWLLGNFDPARWFLSEQKDALTSVGRYLGPPSQEIEERAKAVTLQLDALMPVFSVYMAKNKDLKAFFKPVETKDSWSLTGPKENADDRRCCWRALPCFLATVCAVLALVLFKLGREKSGLVLFCNALFLLIVGHFPLCASRICAQGDCVIMCGARPSIEFNSLDEARFADWQIVVTTEARIRKWTLFACCALAAHLLVQAWIATSV